MEAIYRKHKEDKSISKKTYEAFMHILQIVILPDRILNVLRDFEYQMYCEQQNTAPFKLDFDSLSKAARDNIKRNKKVYQADLKAYGYGANGIWPNIREHNNTFEKYGHAIINEEER